MRLSMFCLMFLLASPAAAQVIEIGSDGTVSVYDRPTMFTAHAATPLPATVTADTPATAPGLADIGRAHGLAPGLLEAVAWRESRGRQDAVSAKGALGVMQLMPATAAGLGVDPRDAVQNLHGGARYLRQQLDRFGSVPLALAAYNAGPGAVLRFGGIPPFRETRAYVSAILARWHVPTGTVAAMPAETPFLIEVAGL